MVHTRSKKSQNNAGGDKYFFRNMDTALGMERAFKNDYKNSGLTKSKYLDIQKRAYIRGFQRKVKTHLGVEIVLEPSGISWDEAKYMNKFDFMDPNYLEKLPNAMQGMKCMLDLDNSNFYTTEQEMVYTPLTPPVGWFDSSESESESESEYKAYSELEKMFFKDDDELAKCEFGDEDMAKFGFMDGDGPETPKFCDTYENEPKSPSSNEDE